MAMKPPALVWPDGRPLRPETLTEEIAAPSYGSGRSISSGHPAQGLTPRRLGQLLRSAEDGDAIAFFELAEEIEEKDLHYLSVMGTRKRAVAQMEITVEEAGSSQQEKDDAQLIRDWLDRDMLEAELVEILDAIGKGVSAIEIVWEMTSKTWLPGALKWRDPRWFEFDRETGERLLLRGAGASTELPAAKFITHVHPAKSGIAIRGGLARAAAWAYMFKNYAIKDWVTFLEAYGHPIRIGKYAPSESETNKNILMNALQEIGVDAWAAFPETMKLEFVDRQAGATPEGLWKLKADYWDSQLSKAVLGQTNTTDAQSGGLGSGQANVHNEVRGDIARADAKLLASTLNAQLVRYIIMLNRGMRERWPRIKIGRPDEQDVKLQVDAAEKLVKMGAKIGARQMVERAGLPAPEADEEPLVTSVPGQAPQSPQGAQEGPERPPAAAKPAPAFLDPLKAPPAANDDRAVASTATLSADPLDDAAEEALGDWERLVRPVTDPIDAAMASANSLVDFRDRLAGLLSGMDVDQVTDQLARSMFAARAAGDVEARGREDG